MLMILKLILEKQDLESTGPEQRPVVDTREESNEISGSIKDRQFLRSSGRPTDTSAWSFSQFRVMACQYRNFIRQFRKHGLNMCIQYMHRRIKPVCLYRIY
jgi:hypothetical protein